MNFNDLLLAAMRNDEFHIRESLSLNCIARENRFADFIMNISQSFLCNSYIISERKLGKIADYRKSNV